jgi:hypothetical protein
MLLWTPLLLAGCQRQWVEHLPPSATASTASSLFTVLCSAGQLAVSWGGPVSEATGQHTVSLVISNNSTRGCYLFGYPQVAVVDKAGRTLPLQYQTSGDQMVTSAAPTHVDLGPNGRGYVTVNKYRCDVGDLMLASVIQITPPGVTSSFSVSLEGNVSMAYCGPGDPGSIVHVSPFEPTFAATVAY